MQGWTGETWRRALKAWDASKDAATKLDAEQEKLVAQLRNVIKQLKDAAKAPRGKPFLIHSNMLKGAMRVKLEDFLVDNALKAQLKQIDEMEMAEQLSRECAEPVYAIFGISASPLVWAYRNGVKEMLEVEPQDLARSLGCPLIGPPVSELKGERTPVRILAALGIPVEWFQP